VQCLPAGLWYILLIAIGCCFVLTLLHNARKDPASTTNRPDSCLFLLLVHVPAGLRYILLIAIGCCFVLTLLHNARSHPLPVPPVCSFSLSVYMRAGLWYILLNAISSCFVLTLLQNAPYHRCCLLSVRLWCLCTLAGLWYILLIAIGCCFVLTLLHNARNDPASSTNCPGSCLFLLLFHVPAGLCYIFLFAIGVCFVLILLHNALSEPCCLPDCVLFAHLQACGTSCSLQSAAASCSPYCTTPARTPHPQPAASCAKRQQQSASETASRRPLRPTQAVLLPDRLLMVLRSRGVTGDLLGVAVQCRVWMDLKLRQLTVKLRGVRRSRHSLECPPLRIGAHCSSLFWTAVL
jgi:hypothetical protein